jgi:DNA-binding CsgD family transcriptional regulator
VSAVEVVGRDAELSSAYGFLDHAADGPAAFVLEGEPGIGKSTLWLAAVAAARRLDMIVLSSRPAEAESGLAHVGLGDLFDNVLDDVLPKLLAPRRRALEIALLRKEKSHESVDYRALVVAVRDVLQVLSDRKSLLLAVDDVQWLDASSSSALAFALRRLGDSRVLVLLTRRLAGNAEPSELERVLPSERVERLRVGAISVGALHRLLRDRLDRTFARQTLLRIHECSGGNPFFALELARVLDADIDPLAPLEVPESLDELVRARIAELPAATRDALALVSALGAPAESLLERAGVETDVLAPAAAAHVIERDNGVVRFTHPLLSSGLYRDVGEERRAVHARIAAIVDDPVLRARHLALSSAAPDPQIAGVLDDAAGVAGDRGAAAIAAELAEHARRLTPADARGDRCRRALAAARAHRAAGEWTRAKTIARDLLTEIGIGTPRAEALVLLAEFEGLDRAITLLEDALREATEQPALQATVHCRLAWATRFKKGFVGALEHAHVALDLADDLDDDAMRVVALGMLAFLGCSVGDADAPAYAARAYELATVTGEAELQNEATDALGGVLTMRRDLDAARALLEREYDVRHERDELSAADALYRLAWVELWGGRWQLAADYAARAHEIQVQYGLEVPWLHLPIAAIAVHRGQLEVARAHSQRALQLGEEQFGLHTPVHLGVLGVAALQSGDPRTAAEWFAEAAAVTRRLGWREASQRWWIADHVEALLELDRVDEAVQTLDAWQADARRLDRKWMLAHATRCRGLVAAARGAVEDSASLLEDAVAQHDHAGDRFGRARALLALGVVRRRERRKRAARDAIGAALDEFEQLGAATWAEKARAELGRIGGRTRVEGLTPAEQRVAALVAEARTNREVAAALFIGERTVETHLSNVYAKLGVRSRAELARTFRPDGQSSGGLTISS